ncbi:regulatory protein RecX [Anaerovoracaceae bacterium 42-11]
MTVSIDNAALRYLSARSRTVFEMKKKLAEKGFAEEEIEALVARFLSYGYLNDEKYCTAYFRYAFGKGKGRRKVFQELRQKGVDSLTIENAFEDYLQEEETEYDERVMALAEAEKVLRTAGVSRDEEIPEKILGRVARRLAGKGYGGETIYSVIGELRR